ncbi:MAG: glycosyltransferase family 2 protein [Lachnospiraceae bacterium]|nr:glycosyltransferase family 2 protein [Lachnospiraceae bacterium]
MKTLIVIPAYNEALNIERVIRRLTETAGSIDYVIIDDGSSDQTADICRAEGFNYISHPVNLGLSAAVQTGFIYALKNGYDAVIQFDGDGQHRGEYIKEMEKRIEEGCDIVIGSRFVTEKKPLTGRMIGSRLIGAMIRLMTGRTIKDPTSGMRMYSKRLIRIFAENSRMTPEPDTVCHLMRLGAKVAEVQVVMDERIAGTSYLNLSKSIRYMLTVSISILFEPWIRADRKLAEKEESA